MQILFLISKAVKASNGLLLLSDLDVMFNCAGRLINQLLLSFCNEEKLVSNQLKDKQYSFYKSLLS